MHRQNLAKNVDGPMLRIDTIFRRDMHLRDAALREAQKLARELERRKWEPRLQQRR